MKLEVSLYDMNDNAAATVLDEIETLIASYAVGKGLKRYIRIKKGE